MPVSYQDQLEGRRDRPFQEHGMGGCLPHRWCGSGGNLGSSAGHDENWGKHDLWNVRNSNAANAERGNGEWEETF